MDDISNKQLLKTNTITHATMSPEICALCAADPRLALVIRHCGDLTYSIDRDPLTHTVESVIGQMLSNKAADAISARLYGLCGGDLTVAAILKLDAAVLRGIGLSGNKAAYILNFAEYIAGRPDFFNDLTDLPDDDVVKKLTALRGIGAWSAKMYLIFVLDRLDVLPYEDGAFLQAYRWLYGTDDLKPKAIMQRCAPWSPYASLAARYMYLALDNGLMKDTALAEQLAGLDGI